MKRISYLLLLLLVSVMVQAQQAKYVFLFIGDGMGLNQVNLTEVYKGALDGKEIGTSPLLFASFPVASFATSFSTSSHVTDSAAGGTALATGRKTYNGAICTNENGDRFHTIAEAAHEAGKRVAILTSVGMNHATPASFYGHQKNRNMYYEIAEEAITSNFEFFGGGDIISPNRKFDKTEAPDMHKRFEDAGMTIARGVDEYKAKAADAKRMVLLNTRPGEASLPYAVDQEPKDITLKQMTESAVDFMMKGGNKKGFFMMVEGGRIDQAGHSNDPGTMVRETIDMDNAVAVAYEFYKKHPKETLILITADHETGGLGVAANGIYSLNMKPLISQKHSFDGISKKITDLRRLRSNDVTWENVKSLLSDELGLWSTYKLDWEQEKLIRDAYEESFVKRHVTFDENMYSSLESVAAAARKVVSQLAIVGYTTNGHTAGYIPVFVVGAGQNLFQAKMDNVDIPKKIAQAAGYKL